MTGSAKQFRVTRAALDCRVAVAPRNDVSIAQRSRDAVRPSFASFVTLLTDRGRREDRVAAAPGAPAPEKLREGRVTTGTGGDTPAFPAQWFYGLYVLSPVNQLFATVARAMR
jgi:hypothetical protein